MDKETDTKLTYEEKRQIKEDKKEKANTTQARSKLVIRSVKWLVWIVILVLIGYWVYSFVAKNIPDGEDLSKEVPLMGASHISVGASHEAYNSNPPTSGPHYEQTARSGFRDEIIPDEHIIHNLEHGDIWISYHPRVSEDVKDMLKKFGAAKVIVTPREANEADIALASWGRLDTFNIADEPNAEQRIRDFINRHINKGPEKVPGMSGGV
ncbi:MAG: DUF3105 domain-containing protein [bacterium]|nr:DUF3105 domain-containing protein [bacterium]